MEIACPTEWFFANGPDRETECPVEAEYWSGTAQNFEHGLMVWQSSNYAPSIQILFDDGSYQAFEDKWSDGMADSDPSLVPPEGLYQPTGSFGLVWRSEADV